MDRAALRAAFQDLRRRGYFARMNWLCCQTCGWAAIPPERTNKAVFYHRQDAASLEEAGGTYVAWSGDGAEIVEVDRRGQIDGVDQRQKVDCQIPLQRGFVGAAPLQGAPAGYDLLPVPALLDTLSGVLCIECVPEREHHRDLEAIGVSICLAHAFRRPGRQSPVHEKCRRLVEEAASITPSEGRPLRRRSAARPGRSGVHVLGDVVSELLDGAENALIRLRSIGKLVLLEVERQAHIDLPASR